MFKKILISGLMRSALLALCLGSGAAQAAVTVSVDSPVSASMATFTLQSSATGTGYLTLLEGTGATCGSVTDIQAGKASGGTLAAYRRGSLALAAGVNASYTVRNLAAGVGYTVCATDTAGTNVASANFTTPAMATYASPQWQTVGGAAVSGGASSYPSLSFAPDGTPYVAYSDSTNSGKTTVKRLVSGSWALVGSAGSFDGTIYQSLSFAPDGTPYVVYEEGMDADHIQVMRWDGNAWPPVGSVINAPNISSVSLSFAPNGTPYVAYSNGTIITVKYFDGSSWTTVGSPITSGSYVFSLSFAPDGTPYVAYSDYRAGLSGKATVKRYNGSVWVDVGTAGFSAGAVDGTSLAFALNGTPYVAYRANGTNLMTVMSYDSGSGWQVVGTGLPVGLDPSLSFAPDGTPYVVYRSGTSPYTSKVVHLVGTTWVSVGAAVSSGSSNSPSLSFAPDGTPYVAYMDSSNNKTIVKRLVSVPGAPTAVTAVAGNGQASVSFTAPASNGGSAVTYTVTTNPGGSTSSCTASPCTVTGLTNGTPYTFTVAANNGVGSSAVSGASGSVAPNPFSLSIATSPAPSAGMATFTLNAGTAATGYLTVLPGGATCGSAAQTLAGKDNDGAVAFRQGSLVLTTGTGNYTVRNLAQSTAYKVCATDGTEVDSKPFSTPAMATYDNPSSWQALGSAGFPTGDQAYPSLTFAPDGTPYVAYSDKSTSKTKVMRWVSGNWESVGSNELSAGLHQYPSLSFAPDGTPYVAYRDDSTSPIGKTTVMHLVGSSWQAVGSPGFSAGGVFFPSLSFAPDGTPYVAYLDGNKAGKTTVTRWDGGSWVVVGSAGFSVGSAEYQSLSFAPDGTPYVAYADSSTSPAGKTTVMRWGGSSWQAVGSPPGFSAGGALFLSLSFAPDGTPYVAYMDNHNSNKATVRRWGDSSWENVGIAGFSAAAAGDLSFSFAPDGKPYVAYRDTSASPVFKTTVMRWNGSSWESVGSTGLSGGNPHFQSLSFAPDGTPYVAYWDKDDYGSSTTGVITVQRLVGLPGAPTAVTAVAGDGQATVSFTAPASNGGSAITGYTVTAKLAASPYTEVASCAPNPVLSTSCVVTGLTNGTAYTITVTANNAGGASAASGSVAVTPAAAATPVVGACGSAHSTTLVTSAPSTGLCTAGTADSVTTGTSAFTWACTGSGGGADSGTCSASRGYTVSPAVSGAGGSISPAGVQTVAYNATQVFTFTADSGNTAAITSNTCGGALSGSTYTSAAITADCTVTASFSASADTTAPSITTLALSGTPTRSSAGVTVTVNESSTGYWLLVGSDFVAPTVAEVKAGVNYYETFVSAKGHRTLTANTAATINLTGLATGTAYTLYVVAEDASNNQSAIGQVAFTTTQISLNDTGQTNCYNAADAVAPCNEATAGDTGIHPRQDGRYGRDVAGMSKVGGGAAGFDFTRICWNGAAEGTATCTGLLVANTTDTASGTAATDWACTKDNVTGLVWSLQSKSARWNDATAPGYADAGHNAAARCGASSDWRLPTRRELLSIVHNGLSTGPVVDIAYFPGTQAYGYWSSNSSVGTPSEAAFVNFVEGRAGFDEKPNNQFVRLVRTAP